MGNENEVKDLVHQVKSQFLPKEFTDFKSRPETYSLEDEFEKTKKNKNILFHLGVAGFIALVILSSIVITNYVQMKNRATIFKITEFEDLKLQEILNNAKKHQKELDLARAELENLRNGMQSELGRARNAGEKTRIKNKYKRLIGQKSGEVETLQKKVDSYDLKLKENIKRAEEMVDNYKKLHRLKMQEQRRYYEGQIASIILKYNPYFTSPALKRILRNPARKTPGKPELKEFRAELAKEGIVSEGDFKNLRKNIDDNYLLLERMNRIPYRNSVMPSLRQMGSFNKKIVEDYETIWYKLVQSVRNKNAFIGNYMYAFDYLSTVKPESGYIIDPRNPKSIRVYIHKIHKVNENDTGMVFRSDDEYIGKIQFFYTDNGLKARVIDIRGNKEIEPFDKILLKKIEGGETK